VPPRLPPRVILTIVALGAVSSAAAGCRATPARETQAAAVAPASRTAPAASIVAVAVGDFAARSRAAEALIAEGDRALPALGEARDEELVAGPGAVVRIDAVIAEILKASSDERLVSIHLADRYPSIRRAAASEAARRGGWGAVPALVERLGDEDVSVRAAVVAALRRMTNRFYDVEPRPTRTEAAAAAASAREWWNREGSLRTADHPHGG
jgi:hypothetical protein